MTATAIQPDIRPVVDLAEDPAPRFDLPAPIGWAGRAVEFLVNPGAGARRRSAGAAERLALALSRAGTLVRRAGRPILGVASSGDAGLQRVIVAVGGDGTVNAGARRAIESGSALLVVPTGTMNLVALDLGLPVRIDDLIAALPALVERRIDVASVNGALFLHSSLLGLVPAFTRFRERLRRPHGARTALGESFPFAQAILRTPNLYLDLDSDRGSARGVTRSLTVTCNPLASARLGEHRRTDLEGGRLAVYASAHAGPLGPMRLLASLVAGRAPSDPDSDIGVCGSLTVRCRHTRLRVANDGAVNWLHTPLKYRVHHRALTVLVPARP